MLRARKTLRRAAALAFGLVLSAAAAGAQDSGSGAPGLGAPPAFPDPSELQLGAPQSGILTIQSDRLFAESAFGRRVAREIEAEGAALTAENRRIEAQLRAEEQDLTTRRASMDPEDFRALADAFDQKVQETRRAQDRKLREINQDGEDARREFFAASLPVLQQIMRESGSGAILEHSTVFLSADSADVTDLAISRINAIIGDGLSGPVREGENGGGAGTPDSGAEPRP